MLNDPEKQVRITSSWCLERVAEMFPEVLANEKNTATLIECILSHLKSTNKLVTHLCNALHHYANYIKPHQEQVSSNYI